MARILIVENDPILAETLDVILTSTGHETVHASTVPAALDIAPDLFPDLAVVDIDFPAGQGLEVIARLHRNMADLEIIAICRKPPSQRCQQVAQVCGASSIVTNPESSDLIQAVQVLVESRAETLRRAREQG